MPSYIPDREADLVPFAANMSNKLDTLYATYGISQAQATSLSAKYNSFNALFTACSEPDTRTPSKLVAKSDAKAALVAEIRMLGRIIQANPALTNEQRTDLGLPNHDSVPSPVPAPSSAPQLNILGVSGRAVRIRLRDAQNPDRRGKPEHVIAANIISCLSDEQPLPSSNWRLEATTGKTVLDIMLPESVPAGALVWISAYWLNSRKVSGPSAAPLSVNIQGGAQAQVA